MKLLKRMIYFIIVIFLAAGIINGNPTAFLLAGLWTGLQGLGVYLRNETLLKIFAGDIKLKEYKPSQALVSLIFTIVLITISIVLYIS